MNRNQSSPLILLLTVFVIIIGGYISRSHKSTTSTTSHSTRSRSKSHQTSLAPSDTGSTTGTSGATGTGQAGDSNEGNLLLGNASNAATEADNFLLERKQYTLSFNHSRGGPNWVAWHVDAADLGKISRGKFRPDPDLPKAWRITPKDYTNSGYDKGHMCPSADRNGTREDNDTTFYMSNMVPQTAELNQHVWADFEDYVRSIVRDGNEVYTVCGVEGNRGTIAGGKVTVPASCWKVVVVLPAGTGDLGRVTPQTRVIAISMPNTNDDSLKNGDWHTFLTTPKQIETSTSLNFFAALPAKVKAALEAEKDAGN